jgi:SOS-response transcriptional repressor LexA
MMPRERLLLHYLQTYIAEHDGVSPTVREIQSHLGMTSPSGPARLLDALERQGLIARFPNRARNIRLTRPPADLAAVPDAEIRAEAIRRGFMSAGATP